MNQFVIKGVKVDECTSKHTNVYAVDVAMSMGEGKVLHTTVFKRCLGMVGMACLSWYGWRGLLFFGVAWHAMA